MNEVLIRSYSVTHILLILLIYVNNSNMYRNFDENYWYLLYNIICIGVLTIEHRSPSCSFQSRMDLTLKWQCLPLLMSCIVTTGQFMMQSLSLYVQCIGAVQKSISGIVMTLLLPCAACPQFSVNTYLVKPYLHLFFTLTALEYSFQVALLKMLTTVIIIVRTISFCQMFI